MRECRIGLIFSLWFELLGAVVLSHSRGQHDAIPNHILNLNVLDRMPVTYVYDICVDFRFLVYVNEANWVLNQNL